jgi:hypothetical protein
MTTVCIAQIEFEIARVTLGIQSLYHQIQSLTDQISLIQKNQEDNLTTFLNFIDNVNENFDTKQESSYLNQHLPEESERIFQVIRNDILEDNTKPLTKKRLKRPRNSFAKDLQTMKEASILNLKNLGKRHSKKPARY